MSWIIPAIFPSLEENMAHIWRISLKSHYDQIEAFENFLSMEEIRRAKKFQTLDLYKKFVITRGALRYLLGQYLTIPPERVALHYTPNGKPFIHSDIAFNISHSSDLAIIGVCCNNEIGIDLEYKRKLDNLSDLCRRFLPEIECHQIFTSPAKLQLSVFYEIWVKKEAYTKAAGQRIFEILADFKKRNVSITAQRDYFIEPIVIDGHYACAFATRSRVMSMKCWQFCLLEGGETL